MNVKRISDGVIVQVGTLVAAITNAEALALADRLYALAGDAEDAEVIDYPEADREASRADFLIKQRKEEADMAEYEVAA